LAFGGNDGASTAATEEYDGTNWATSPASLSTVRYGLAGAGNASLGLAFGGGDTAYNAETEEWTGAGSPLTKTITVS
jgi:hypothetical protein